MSGTDFWFYLNKDKLSYSWRYLPIMSACLLLMKTFNISEL